MHVCSSCFKWLSYFLIIQLLKLSLYNLHTSRHLGGRFIKVHVIHTYCHHYSFTQACNKKCGSDGQAFLTVMTFCLPGPTSCSSLQQFVCPLDKWALKVTCSARKIHWYDGYMTVWIYKNLMLCLKGKSFLFRRRPCWCYSWQIWSRKGSAGKQW